MKTHRFSLDLVVYVETDDVDIELIESEPTPQDVEAAIREMTGGELFESKLFCESGWFRGWKVSVEINDE